jgi:hypothetical protein
MLGLLIDSMSIEQILQDEIRESKTALDGSNDDSTYRREHSKRIELINWVLDNMKNTDFPICDVIFVMLWNRK